MTFYLGLSLANDQPLWMKKRLVKSIKCEVKPNSFLQYDLLSAIFVSHERPKLQGADSARLFIKSIFSFLFFLYGFQL